MDTGAEGGNMVFVKVRETYDLHTVKNKMTVIAVHTPRPDIIKRNYPGLLMQCRAYRPYAADVRVACASVQPLDPLGIGTQDGDVAPEDVFNPILYKAMSNKGMSQLEARINWMNDHTSSMISTADVDGETAMVDVDSLTARSNEFDVYYGLLSNTHDWRHANPQAGLEMRGLKPFVYDLVYNIGDSSTQGGLASSVAVGTPDENGSEQFLNGKCIVGKAKEFPFLNCTSYSATLSKDGKSVGGFAVPGFTTAANQMYNCEQNVPYLNVIVGCIIVPPSRLHELFYRMVVEWTLEFTQLRPLAEIGDWNSLVNLGSTTHYQNYDYSSTKEAVTGSDDTILDSDSCMVSSNVDINKVM